MMVVTAVNLQVLVMIAMDAGIQQDITVVIVVILQPVKMIQLLQITVVQAVMMLLRAIMVDLKTAHLQHRMQTVMVIVWQVFR
jgi:hypothetical protein